MVQASDLQRQFSMLLQPHGITKLLHEPLHPPSNNYPKMFRNYHQLPIHIRMPSHAMHVTMLRPLPESLPEEEEQDPERAPEGDQGHVGHDGWYVPAGEDPGRDEFGETVAPDILVDGDADEDTARDGLVAVNSVGGGNGREGSNLDTGACVADDDDGLGGMS